MYATSRKALQTLAEEGDAPRATLAQLPADRGHRREIHRRL
ncbi:hypothetical protein [Streptomyces sp. NPDC093984]